MNSAMKIHYLDVLDLKTTLHLQKCEHQQRIHSLDYAIKNNHFCDLPASLQNKVT